MTTTKTGKLDTLATGSSFTYGGIAWVVLEHAEGKTLALSAEIVETRAFDTEDKNDFAASSLREYLNGEFFEQLQEDGADAEAFDSMTLDLTSDDGLKDYGTCLEAIGLISCEQYRRFRAIIPNVNSYWWTCTPYSTEKNGYSYVVRGVGTSGALLDSGAYYGYRGVRPLCNLFSDILVSFECEETAEDVPAEADKRTQAVDMINHIAAAFNIPASIIDEHTPEATQNDEAAQMIYNTYAAFIKSGFSETQAFQLILKLVQNGTIGGEQN